MKNSFNLVKFQLRKKSNYLTALIIGILIAVAILSNTYQKTNTNFVENDIYQNLDFRQLRVTGKSDREKDMATLKDITHIVNVAYMTHINKTVEIVELDNNSTNLNSATNESLPKIIMGSDFADDDGAYMVCPYNYYKFADFITKNTKENRIDLKKYLNTELTLKYYGNLYGITKDPTDIYETKVRLVGIYKNSDYSIDEADCYVNHKVYNEIVENMYKKDKSNYEFNKTSNFIITVDDIKNLEEVEETLKNLDFNYEAISFINYDKLAEMNNQVTHIITFIFILISLFIFLIYQKDFNDDKEYYILLYKLGYNMSKVKITYIITMMLKTIIYLFFTLIISSITYIGLKTVLDYYPFLFYKYRLMYDLKSIIYVIFLFIINIILNGFINFRKIDNDI